MIYDTLDRRQGEFVSRVELEKIIYTSKLAPAANCIQVFIYRMREKGIEVETKRGKGYRLTRGSL